MTGCGILGVGIWLRVAYEGYATLLPQYAMLSADILAIVVGIIACILSFCACCGSWMQSRFMLITFHCCGVQNYEDWYMIDAWPTKKWVPDSCCVPAVKFGVADER
ncbi:tetraspanin-9-like, partial [Agrilus planipennis]|uniref:Tetraspanin-9-like n=1 Tax=Agrilus planipennis TaxID=224129 RepID=A0A7F5RGY5_AGRPL